MPAQAWSETDLIREWTERESRHIDLTASWEVLCDVYDQLRFTDTLMDSMRLEEFKWIVKEMNKFLTRTRNGLMKAKGIKGAVEYMGNQMYPTETTSVQNRQQLAYNKLRQRWIMQGVAQLTQAMNDMEDTDEGEEEYGR